MMIIVGIIILLIALFLILKMIADNSYVDGPDMERVSYVPCKIEYKEFGGFLDRYILIYLTAQKKVIILKQNNSKKEYKIDYDAFSYDIDAFILRYNLTNWEHKPLDDFVLDGETKIITIECNNGFIFNLTNDEEIPSDKVDIFNTFKDLLLSYCKKKRWNS